VIYDITKYATFLGAKKWYEELRAAAGPECVIYLIGNKIDQLDTNPFLR